MPILEAPTFSQQRFEQWLAKQPPDDILGDRTNPISLLAAEFSDRPNLRSQVWIENGYLVWRQPIPDWMKEMFAILSTHTGKGSTDFRRRAIPAKEVSSIMAEVRRRLKSRQPEVASIGPAGTSD